MTGAKTTERRSGLRILVVDDNRDAADSLSMLFRLWGYEVEVAYDGMEALETACSFLPQCLFLDIGLPGLDGYTLARRIREQPALNGAKLIALSAYSEKEQGQRGLEAGFDYRFVKPADLNEVKELLTMLQEVMQVAQETKELIQDTKAELKEVRQEIREVKEELKEIKEVIRGDPGLGEILQSE